ncbi:interleukin-36 alpha-like [Gracilinanus agilis]|uniref:interleukin-36 alpha-like n=1 Tax=Gracilinanus agilis TaxID=191870 RepID=UPI001CFC5883|nr:interleukin-36 alpha-like [Gracilinanus agilis]
MIEISFVGPKEKEIHDIHQYVWVLQGSILVAVPNDETVKAGLTSSNSNGFSILDSNQQVLSLQDKTLIATPYTDHVIPVTLEILPCRDPEYPVRDERIAVYLGISGKDLCLLCEESRGQPILKLEDKKIMDLYSSQKAQKPFVFYQNQIGNTSTLESAAYPGWFICTSTEIDQPVTITQHIGPNHNIAFYLSP